VRDGYAGKVRAVRMSVGVDAFAEVMPEAVRWVVDDANFTHLLSIYGGHFQTFFSIRLAFQTDSSQ
jgi:hypothetical protein